MNRTPFTISAVFKKFLKRTETLTNMNNSGSRHKEIQETRSLIRQYKNGYSANCATWQEAEELNPNDDKDYEESRHRFLSNFDWKDSMLQQHEIKKIESLLVEFHNIFERHRFENGMNEEFTVELTKRMITSI